MAPRPWSPSPVPRGMEQEERPGREEAPTPPREQLVKERRRPAARGPRRRARPRGVPQGPGWRAPREVKLLRHEPPLHRVEPAAPPGGERRRRHLYASRPPAPAPAPPGARAPPRRCRAPRAAPAPALPRDLGRTEGRRRRHQVRRVPRVKRVAARSGQHPQELQSEEDARHPRLLQRPRRRQQPVARASPTLRPPPPAWRPAAPPPPPDAVPDPPDASGERSRGDERHQTGAADAPREPERQRVRLHEQIGEPVPLSGGSRRRALGPGGGAGKPPVATPRPGSRGAGAAPRRPRGRGLRFKFKNGGGGGRPSRDRGRRRCGGRRIAAGSILRARGAPAQSTPGPGAGPLSPSRLARCGAWETGMRGAAPSARTGQPRRRRRNRP